MFHYLLVLLSMLPSVTCCVYCVHRVVPLTHPIRFTVFSVGGMVLLWAVNYLLLPAPTMLLDFMQFLWLFAILLLMAPKGGKAMALFSVSILIVATLVAINVIGWTAISAASLLGIDPARLADMKDPAYIVMSVIVGCITIPIQLVLSALLRRLTVHIRNFSGLMWVLTIPVSQIFLLLLANQTFDPFRTYTPWESSIPGLLLCVLADAACILGYRRYHRMEQLSSQVSEAEHQLNIQNEYYREMQSNILKINQIRHDLNNQLQTAYYLLENGHPQEVRQQLDLLKGSLRENVGTRYCENLMVDAVLTEKASLCTKHGIPLEISALVPAELPIESAHLCSAFSNLLDNCIAGTLEQGTSKEPIRLYSDIQSGYLTIHCSNPSLPPRKPGKKDVMRSHGLGLEILGQLARTYEGTLQTGYQDSRFSVTMTMKIR